MSDQTTNVKIGFRSDTSGIEGAVRQVSRLEQMLGKLKSSEKSLVQSPGRSVSQMSQGGGLPSLLGGMSSPVGGGVSSVKGLLGGAMRGGIAGVGLGALAGVAGITAYGISQAIQYQKAIDGLSKRFHVAAKDQDALTSSIQDAGNSLSITNAQMSEITGQYIAQAGALEGVAGAVLAVKDAGRLAMGLGTDTGETVTQFAGLAQKGAYGSLSETKMDQKDFAVMIAEAVSTGGMKGREGELIQSIDTLVGTQLQTLTSAGGIGGMFEMVNAMNSTKEAGLMGARGAQLLGQVNSGIQNPGAGAMGEFFSFQALGKGKDYYEYQKIKEEGAFGENENLSKILDEFKAMFPDNANARHYAMGQVLGISMHQAEGIEKAVGGMSQQDRTALVDTLKGALGEEGLGTLDMAKMPIMAEIASAKDKETRIKALSDERLDLTPEKIEELSTAPIEDVLRQVADSRIKDSKSDALQGEIVTLQNKISDLGLNAIGPLINTLGATNEIGSKIYELMTGTEAADKDKPSVLGKMWQGLKKDFQAPGVEYDEEGKRVTDIPIAKWSVSDAWSGLKTGIKDSFKRPGVDSDAPVSPLPNVKDKIGADAPVLPLPNVKDKKVPANEVKAAADLNRARAAQGGQDMKKEAPTIVNDITVITDGKMVSHTTTTQVGNGNASRSMPTQ